jgi:hypothetical protein
LIPVLIVLEDFSTLDASHNEVMERTGGIDAGFSWHGNKDIK